jgi:hypothetical protein
MSWHELSITVPFEYVEPVGSGSEPTEEDKQRGLFDRIKDTLSPNDD